MTRQIFILVLYTLAGLVLTGCACKARDVSDVELKKAIAGSKQTVLVLFTSQRPGNTGEMHAHVEHIAKDYGRKVRVYCVDIDSYPAAAEDARIPIVQVAQPPPLEPVEHRLTPILVAYRDGKTFDHLTGRRTLKEVQSFTDDVLVGKKRPAPERLPAISDNEFAENVIENVCVISHTYWYDDYQLFNNIGLRIAKEFKGRIRVYGEQPDNFFWRYFPEDTPQHPSFLVFRAGHLAFRVVGEVEAEARLRDAVEKALMGKSDDKLWPPPSKEPTAADLWGPIIIEEAEPTTRPVSRPVTTPTTKRS